MTVFLGVRKGHRAADDPDGRLVRTFADLGPSEEKLAGGKGGTLAHLYRSGYPVPDGLVVMPAAFTGDDLLEPAWRQIQVLLERMRRGTKTASFSVRSSALGEDSPRASFAGQFETVLDVHGDDDIRAGITTVRRSRHAERVRTYSEARGIAAAHEMAVVVQKMVSAELSGVLFTADPLTGDRATMMGNFVRGLGEELVSGNIEAARFTLGRPKGRYAGPPEIKRFARRLFRLAVRLERDLGAPQDIEWAVADGKVYILQSRPITTLIGWDPTSGESNDSRTGDYLWSSVNVGEAMSVVMTPFTSSVVRMLYDDALGVVPGHPWVGSIGGRLYQNVTVIVTFARALRQDMDISSELGGVPREYMGKTNEFLTPLPQVSRFPILIAGLRMAARQRRSLRGLRAFVAGNPAWCRTAQQRIETLGSVTELRDFDRDELWPRNRQAFWMVVASGIRYGQLVAPLRRELTELVGAADADILLSSVSNEEELLASLGPVVGLAGVASGRTTREEYLEKWGHRGPLETEQSEPRPSEDPGWLDRQLAEYQRSAVDVEGMLAAKRAEYLDTWERFQDRYPRLKDRMDRKLKKAAEAARAREAVRSEQVRTSGVGRRMALRIGELTGLGSDIFYLTFQEVLDHLAGGDAPIAYIEARRNTYERYKTLPPYPVVIRGRFEPFQWAADPNRDSRFSDSHGLLSTLYSEPVQTNLIIGVPGSAGIVEGTVRRLDSPEQGGEMHGGEILVTSQTNIGWTLLFPKAGAIVTDVGAPLSHAAVVARELGIPAVVNCGNATTHLHTGDRVRVNGTQGTVEMLEGAQV